MMLKRTKEELFILWGMLDIEFFKLPPASHSKVAEQVIEWILWRERLRNNLEHTEASQYKSDTRTVKALKGMDTDNPELVVLEKVFRQLVNDRGEKAMGLLQAAIQNKQNQISSRQRVFSKNPRPKARHPISIMTDEIVEENPEIKVNALFHQLRAASKKNTSVQCHFDFSKDAFIPIDEKWDPVPKANLSDVLYRAKLRIKRTNRLE